MKKKASTPATPPAIRVETKVSKCVHGTRKILEAIPVSILKEWLRIRSIPIPKEKDKMIDRLVVHLGKAGASINAVIR